VNVALSPEAKANSSEPYSVAIQNAGKDNVEVLLHLQQTN